MLQDRIQRQIDFFFVMGGRHDDEVKIWKDGHILASRTDSADEVDFFVRGNFAFIVKVVKVALPLVSRHDFLDVVGGKKLLAVVFPLLKDGGPTFDQSP